MLSVISRNQALSGSTPTENRKRGTDHCMILDQKSPMYLFIKAHKTPANTLHNRRPPPQITERSMRLISTDQKTVDMHDSTQLIALRTPSFAQPFPKTQK